MSIPTLASYSLLGRSGLRVSPLCLGTMTFGTEWGFGSPRDTVFDLLARYLDAGGNFIDTADGYTGGTSEKLIGEFLKDSGRRDGVVLATKFSFNVQPGDPNAGGNSRKHIRRALDASLKRLQTDYVDLYWLHAWDGLTPVEEVMSTLDDLVRAGKVRYIGLSDVPAWYLARAQTIAELRGSERLAGLQLEYSLVERNIEREHIPAALALGLGLCPWSPLGSGMLTGKYDRKGTRAEGQGRLVMMQDSGNPAFEKLTSERNWQIVDALVEVARELGRSPAQVALNWVTTRPGVTSTIIGATKPAQLDDNLKALEFTIPAELSAKLEAVSRPETVHPYHFFSPGMRGMLTGGTAVQTAPAWYWPR
ncbi:MULTISPECIES: aldo/keto reductase [Nannocystis]|uniref:Aldo/keto reductase n=1 Tax=Nannocystis radixulma TaxID=2995305 RepID=A0ABT5B6K4_9BACT|nr:MULTISPECIES: aldo/keto reductase [Nannocystis]MCY1061140.1 aldo/keto reductase [Nannocystis sp. SCPEA4]MDC0669747.1 aldo/keto reductase [Nannocystis radixulma]